MGEIRQIGQNHRRAGAGIILIAKARKCPGHVARHQRAEQADNAGAVGKAEHGAHRFGIDAAAAMGNRLVEQRQAITHRALRGAGDHGQRFVVDRNAFLGRRRS
jgi:hypothetical protein